MLFIGESAFIHPVSEITKAPGSASTRYAALVPYLLIKRWLCHPVSVISVSSILWHRYRELAVRYQDVTADPLKCLAVVAIA